MFITKNYTVKTISVVESNSNDEFHLSNDYSTIMKIDVYNEIKSLYNEINSKMVNKIATIDLGFQNNFISFIGDIWYESGYFFSCGFPRSGSIPANIAFSYYNVIPEDVDAYYYEILDEHWLVNSNRILLM